MEGRKGVCCVGRRRALEGGERVQRRRGVKDRVEIGRKDCRRKEGAMYN